MHGFHIDLHALASHCKVDGQTRVLSDEQREVSGNHSLRRKETGPGVAQDPLSGTVCLRPHEAPLPRALEEALCFAWRQPRRRRQGTLAKSTRGGSSRTGTLAQRRRLTWATLVPRPHPLRALHFLNAGGGQLGPLGPQHGEQTQPGRQEEQLPGQGPRVRSGGAWPRGHPFIPGPAVPPPPLHKGPSVRRGGRGDIVFFGSREWRFSIVSLAPMALGSDKSGEALSGRRMLERKAVPLGSEPGDKTAASLCSPLPSRGLHCTSPGKPGRALVPRGPWRAGPRPGSSSRLGVDAPISPDLLSSRCSLRSALSTSSRRPTRPTAPPYPSQPELIFLCSGQYPSVAERPR